jgi:hypothetical protein
MIHKKQIGKETDANTSIYEAVGKMLLGNVTAGRMVNPATLGLIDKALKTGQDSEYEELLEKPLWQFTGKDHEYMLKHVLMESFTSVDAEPSSQKRYVQGYQGIASLFGCSKSTAQRIKKSGIIDDAITQVNRKILVDADLALQLVKESEYKVNEQ